MEGETPMPLEQKGLEAEAIRLPEQSRLETESTMRHRRRSTTLTFTVTHPVKGRAETSIGKAMPLH
jgi:hypothetical protein